MYVSSFNVVSREFCVAGSTGLGGTLSVPLGYKKLAVCIGLLNPRPDTLVSNLHLQACRATSFLQRGDLCQTVK